MKSQSKKYINDLNTIDMDKKEFIQDLIVFTVDNHDFNFNRNFNIYNIMNGYTTNF